MIQPERIHKMKTGTRNSGTHVVYWMQAAQRVENNHALAFAIELANQKQVGLIVAMVLMPAYPSANTRHYRFMIEGLSYLKSQLEGLGALFHVAYGEATDVVATVTEDACALVMDDVMGAELGHLKKEVVGHVTCDAYYIETNVIVPVKHAYPKEAYAAYAIRNALNRKLDAFAIPFQTTPVARPIPNTHHEIFREDWAVNEILKNHYGHLEIINGPVTAIGGEDQANILLKAFVETHLASYGEASNNPGLDATSKLSAYLHFGMISPITILEAVRKANVPSGAFVEQLFVRRELAYNYVRYNPNYKKDLFQVLPDWAIQQLKSHGKDVRPYVYSPSEIESAQTHDPYWNAAQKEMVKSGFMHNTMRMYWGKKIIEWTPSYEAAFDLMIYLNDKYLLDGRDPNGYAGIAWCFGKHDRPFSERPIFGKIRYMNDKGLKRKYDMESYIKRVEALGGQDDTLSSG